MTRHHRFLLKLHLDQIDAFDATIVRIDKEVDTDRSIAFLKALDRELDANWCLVWDRLNAHRANKTRMYLDTASRLSIFFFPS